MIASLIAIAVIQSPQVALEAAIKAYCKENNVPSIGYAIGAKGKIEITGAVQGVGPEPVASNTVYRLGSISKPVTTVATLQLVEQGKLDLDADIRKAVPEWPDKGVPITLRQLLGHLGGIRHYGSKGDVYFTKFANEGEALKIFKNDPLIGKPGEKYSYSTHAFTLVARACENASGVNFPELIRTRVSAVAGTPALQCEDRQSPNRDRAVLYEKVLNTFRKAARAEDLSWKYGGGGLESTPSDLCKFALAVFDGKLLKQSTVDQMWTPQKTNDGKATGYGMGWSVSSGKYGRVAGHSGAQQGAQSDMKVFRDRGTVIVLMSNIYGHPLGKLTTQIADIYFAK